MPAMRHVELTEIEEAICAVALKVQGVREAHRLCTLEELSLMDSLDLAEFFMELENQFGIATVPRWDSPNPVHKMVFTRSPLLVKDLAELMYLQQGEVELAPRRPKGRKSPSTPHPTIPFCQVSGVWEPSLREPLYERIPETSPRQYRRSSDGMRCIVIPAATVEVGSDAPDSHDDEGPLHAVHLDSFIIDAEPVSTIAYCRFLNSARGVPDDVLREWFALEDTDHRDGYLPVILVDGKWRPRPGTERKPVVLVSWFGANAYSLWANNHPWVHYRDQQGADSHCFLPSEAQWEYAARGARYQRFPWGDAEPTPSEARFGIHTDGDEYTGESLPMADVNEPLGLSPFGLHHMAGNVWQWCRDWYSESFYERGDAGEPNPVNRWDTGIRSERGGSWVGPARLCRSSYRRGRPPLARGRCLGFRCVGPMP